MSSNIDALISEAKELARKHNHERAMLLANELVQRHPNELKVWSLRGYLHRRNRKYANAIADLTHAIEICESRQTKLDLQTGVLTSVDLFFNRGADKFALGENQSAIDDFTRALQLCDYYNSDDYRETLYFWRAEAFLRLGKKREALLDLTHVNDGFRFWTYKLRTKAELLIDCNKLSG
jgi:tetratricopeptide (TPR) repeat protein